MGCFGDWAGEGEGVWYPDAIADAIRAHKKYDVADPVADPSSYVGPPNRKPKSPPLHVSAPRSGLCHDLVRQDPPPSFEDVAYGDADASAMDVDYVDPGPDGEHFHAGGCNRRAAYVWWLRVTKGHPHRSQILSWVRGIRTGDLLTHDLVDEMIDGCGSADGRPVRAFFDPHRSARPAPYTPSGSRKWRFKNSKACTTDFLAFMRSQIKADLAGGQLVEWKLDSDDGARLPRQCAPQSVEPSKPRRCCNQRAWNEYYTNPSCRYDGASTVFDMSSPHSYLYAYDHKAGFFNIAVHPLDWEDFGICFEGKYYVYTTLVRVPCLSSPLPRGLLAVVPRAFPYLILFFALFPPPDRF